MLVNSYQKNIIDYTKLFNFLPSLLWDNMKTEEQKQNDLNKIKALLRKERIDLLGAFGNRREKIIPDVTKYTRKEKHKGK